MNYFGVAKTVDNIWGMIQDMAGENFEMLDDPQIQKMVASICDELLELSKYLKEEFSMENLMSKGNDDAK